MLWTPPTQSKVISNGGIVGTGTLGVAVPSNGSTDTYGAVTEILSAAANVQDSWGIMVMIQGSGAVATSTEASMDILIGGATDDVLIKSLLCGYTYEAASVSYFFPLHIPAGLRLAAQFSTVRAASFNVSCMVHLYGGGIPPFPIGKKVTALGTKGTNSRGLTVTPSQSGAAAAVTQMTASSAEQYIAFLPGFSAHGDNSIAAGTVNVGIGLGASTEERIGTWTFMKDVGEHFSGPLPCLPVFRTVPAGTRISLLTSNQGTNDTTYNGHVYAVS